MRARRWRGADHPRPVPARRRRRRRRCARSCSGSATCSGSAVLLVALPLVCAAVRRRGPATGWPAAATLDPARVPPASRGAACSCGWKRLAAAHRAADAPGPGAVRARAAGRGSCWTGCEPGGAARSPTGSARTLRGRYPLGPAAAAADRPVRDGRADPLLQRRRHAHRHAARWSRCRRCSSAGDWQRVRREPGRARSRLRGDDDVIPREYRHGDDLRRVHWRSTARVRRADGAPRGAARRAGRTVLLDTRRHAHRGAGPGSAFEWAVSALASVGVYIARRGYPCG